MDFLIVCVGKIMFSTYLNRLRVSKDKRKKQSTNFNQQNFLKTENKKSTKQFLLLKTEKFSDASLKN